MIPINFMPFVANYWPYILGGVFLYVFLFISFDKARSHIEQAARESPAKKRFQPREAPDDSDEEEDGDKLEEDATDETKEVAQVPYKWNRYSEDEMTRRSEDFYHLMKGRRSVRLFSDRHVPREILENIIRTAGTSPSGAHTEPWSYVVVADKELKQRVREIIETEEEVNYKKRMGDEWTNALKPIGTDWNKGYLTTVPYIVLLFKQVYGFKDDGKKKNHYYNEISCSISAGLFLAAVQNSGLATLTSTPLNCGPALRSLLGRPSNEKLLLCLPIGYPAEDATVPDFARKDIDDIMVFMD